MYKYVKRELELLQLPALGQDLGDGGDQVDLPLVADLVETRGDGHVGQTVTEIVEVSKYSVWCLACNLTRRRREVSVPRTC